MSKLLFYCLGGIGWIASVFFGIGTIYLIVEMSILQAMMFALCTLGAIKLGTESGKKLDGLR